MGTAPTIAALHASGRLSTRARNALVNDAGCESLADIGALSMDDVAALANVGPGTVAEITATLQAHGMDFAQAPAPEGDRSPLLADLALPRRLVNALTNAGLDTVDQVTAALAAGRLSGRGIGSNYRTILGKLSKENKMCLDPDVSAAMDISIAKAMEPAESPATAALAMWQEAKAKLSRKNGGQSARDAAVETMTTAEHRLAATPLVTVAECAAVARIIAYMVKSGPATDNRDIALALNLAKSLDALANDWPDQG